jgi:hypothetical protein
MSDYIYELTYHLFNNFYITDKILYRLDLTTLRYMIRHLVRENNYNSLNTYYSNYTAVGVWNADEKGRIKLFDSYLSPIYCNLGKNMNNLSDEDREKMCKQKIDDRMKETGEDQMTAYYNVFGPGRHKQEIKESNMDSKE